MNRYMKLKRLVFLLISVLILNCAAPLGAAAEDSSTKVVRVGWHEPPYFIRDESGRQSGYSYEYQCKVAAYTGWEYEYVEGSFTELLQKLKNGEIDLLSDVSYTQDRTNYMLYSSIPMGTESYYVFVSPHNKEITSDNIQSLNGKRIGVTKDTVQKDYFLDWEQKHNIKAELIELNKTEEESMKLLDNEIDAYITMDVYTSPYTAVPVCKIGSSDFFFAVNKDRPDLLTDLDAALNRIQDENKYYDQQLHDKYLKSTETNRYLTTSEKDWLSQHGTITVGYQDNYLAFCAKDQDTGELTGALKDYLDYASTGFENAKINFRTVCYPTANEALEALKNGEIDCMFPANITDYDAEKLGLILSPPLMNTEMDAVVRASEQKEFLMKQDVTVAVNEGNTNYDIFLEDNYPNWSRKYYKDTSAGLEAIADYEADCVIISNYRYNNISKQCEKLHLTTVYTGVDSDFSIAIRKGDKELYSIIARITGIVPNAVIHTALTYYSTEDVKTSFLDYIKDNLFIVTAVIAAIMLIIAILLLRSIKAERKAAEEEKVIKSLNRRVNVDALTSVRNKGAYSDYMKKLQNRIDSGEKPEFAVVIFDCNDLKKINDQHGHDKGDIYLKAACSLICKVFDHSPVFRIGGDEFAAVLLNDDYDQRDELMRKFEIKRREICKTAENKWEEIHIAAGMAVFDPELDASVSDTEHRADKIMYDNKRETKSGS